MEPELTPWKKELNYGYPTKMKEKRKALELTPYPGKEGLKYGYKKDGTIYTVRDNRHRYFFPNEWNEFFKNIKKPRTKVLFEFLILTGARIEEALCVKINHIRWDRNYVTLYVTKVKAKKGQTKPVPRDVTLPTHFIKRLRKYIQLTNLGENDYLFLNNSKNYSTMKELKQEAKIKKISAFKFMKYSLNKTKIITDPWNFSLHNIRKTHGMFLKALGVRFEEICLRLSHDANTYLKHYGSTDIFTVADKRQMVKILGDIYNLGKGFI